MGDIIGFHCSAQVASVLKRYMAKPPRVKWDEPLSMPLAEADAICRKYLSVGDFERTRAASDGEIIYSVIAPTGKVATVRIAYLRDDVTELYVYPPTDDSLMDAYVDLVSDFLRRWYNGSIFTDLATGKAVFDEGMPVPVKAKKPGGRPGGMNAERNKRIYEAYKGGKERKALAHDEHLSYSTIKGIVRDMRAAEKGG